MAATGGRYALEFGWDGDGGTGARLIARILAGTKTATCCPASLLDADELAAMRGAVGHEVELRDHLGHVHGLVHMHAVETTTWGDPPESLVRGEGYETADAFRAAHAGVWDDLLGGPPEPATTLVVERFELVTPRGR